MSAPKPKPYPNDWRMRWVVLPSWRVLHRVAKDTRKEPWECKPGTTVCGQSGKVFMPGIRSRMDLRRCAKCCDLLNIPRGYGAPFNEFEAPMWEREKNA